MVSDSRWIHDRAARPMSGMDFDKRRKLRGAGGNAVLTARFKRASGRKLSDGWDGAFDGREWNAAVG